jgi:hypothetical protein
MAVDRRHARAVPHLFKLPPQLLRLWLRPASRLWRARRRSSLPPPLRCPPCLSRPRLPLLLQRRRQILQLEQRGLALCQQPGVVCRKSLHRARQGRRRRAAAAVARLSPKRRRKGPQLAFLPGSWARRAAFCLLAVTALACGGHMGRQPRCLEASWETQALGGQGARGSAASSSRAAGSARGHWGWAAEGETWEAAGTHRPTAAARAAPPPPRPPAAAAPLPAQPPTQSPAGGQRCAPCRVEPAAVQQGIAQGLDTAAGGVSGAAQPDTRLQSAAGGGSVWRGGPGSKQHPVVPWSDGKPGRGDAGRQRSAQGATERCWSSLWPQQPQQPNFGAPHCLVAASPDSAFSEHPWRPSTSDALGLSQGGTGRNCSRTHRSQHSPAQQSARQESNIHHKVSGARKQRQRCSFRAPGQRGARDPEEGRHMLHAKLSKGLGLKLNPRWRRGWQ